MKNLIRKIAWKYANQAFNQNLNIDFEELFAEANLAYLEAFRTYDESKSKITTHIWNTVSGHLNDYIRDELKHSHIDISEIEKAESDAPYFEKLSKDAHEIADFILSDFKYVYMDRFDAQVTIGQDLLKKGWSWTKICKGFKDLTLIYG